MNGGQALAALQRAYPILTPVTLTFTGTTPGWAEYLTNERQIRLHPDYDYASDPHLLAHEAGHAWHQMERVRRGVVAAFHETAEGPIPRDPVLDDFWWSARGYPGTWLDAELRRRRMLREGQPWPDAYRYDPREAVAECFAALWLGYPVEQQEPARLKVETYGVPLDAGRMAAFFGLDPIAYLLTYPVTRGFGDLSFPQFGAHTGCDLGLPAGTPVYAIADGIVTVDDDDAAYDQGDARTWSGIAVSYRLAEDGATVTDAHLSRNVVQHGKLVREGQLLGYSGSTGASTGPHLHHEIRLITGDFIDPITYMEARMYTQEDRDRMIRIEDALNLGGERSWLDELYDKLNAGFSTTLLTWLRRAFLGRDPFTGKAPIVDPDK